MTKHHRLGEMCGWCNFGASVGIDDGLAFYRWAFLMHEMYIWWDLVLQPRFPSEKTWNSVLEYGQGACLILSDWVRVLTWLFLSAHCCRWNEGIADTFNDEKALCAISLFSASATTLFTGFFKICIVPNTSRRLLLRRWVTSVIAWLMESTFFPHSQIAVKAQVPAFPSTFARNARTTNEY